MRLFAQLVRVIAVFNLALLGAPLAVSAALRAEAPSASASTGPTVRDVVQFTRIVHPRYQDGDLLQQQVSPDGDRVFIVTRRSDVRRDSVHYELLLLDISPYRLSAARQAAPQPILKIDAGRAHDDDGWQAAFVQDVSWLDDRTIVLRARMRDAPYQVFKLDVPTRRLTQLTFDPRGVLSFGVSDDLRRVVYVVQAPNPPMSRGARSVVVGSQRFWSVMFGQNNVRVQVRRYAFLVSEAGSRWPARQLGETVDEVGGMAPRVSVSRDGRWAVLPVPAPERQDAWVREYPFVKQQAAEYGPSVARDPLHYFSPPAFWVPRRMAVYRLSDGRAQSLIDAPDDAPTGLRQQRRDRFWLKDGKSMVFAGTLLPRGLNVQGQRDASHIIEYWPSTGRWKLVATLNQRLLDTFSLRGRGDRFVAIDGDKRRGFRRLGDGTWEELTEADMAAEEARDRQGPARRWAPKIEQGLNRPPDVVAVGPSGRVTQLTNLNPSFSAQTWGTMRPYSWKDAKERRWDGGLMLPANFDPAVPHALVIQTYGFDPTRFYLDGSNVVDGFGSGFAGRAFMRDNILVLAMPTDPSTQRAPNERRRTLAFIDGVESVIEALASKGVVSRERVGVMGWSMTGEHVLNLVTFSNAAIRAATLLDGDANTLFASAVTYGFNDELLFRKEATNEGPAFGETLNNWVRNDPSLHTDCVHAALRIETYGPAVQSNWDVYALLRRQYKPAEMIVVPGGAHALGRPSERMISLQGNVDWYRFWLRDEERGDVFLPGETPVTLTQQYERWRQMAELKRLDEGRPRCPLRPAAP